MVRNVVAFIFPAVMEAWGDQEADSRFRALIDFGITAIATESDTYDDRLIERIHRLGLRFLGSISCFSSHGDANKLLEHRPELHPILETGERRPLMEWYIGVTPTFDDYRESRLDLLENILRNHELDGMWLDFIRWPLHWELEIRRGASEPLQSSFDPHTLQRFLEYADLEMPGHIRSTPEQAHWILNEHRGRWTDFKCTVITNFVAQANERVKSIRATVDTGVFLVPASDEKRAYLVGQRIADLASHVDFLSPMAYHPVLHRTPQWAIGVVNDEVNRAPGQIIPVYQVDSAEGAELGADFGPPVPISEWQTVACDAASRDDLAGIAAFTGTALFADNRGKALRDCLAGEQG
jgi:hypothetical protein